MLQPYGSYLRERFPPGPFILLAATFSAVAGVGMQTHLAGKISAPGALVAGFAALFLFLLRLRIFDEFKDAQHDARFYPQRAVPRGLITLTQLRRLLWVVVVGELGIAVWAGRVPFLFFTAATLYSLLMFHEFFLREWLRARFTAYIFTHEVLVFPLFLYLFSLNGMPMSRLRDPAVWLLALLLIAQLFLLEIARKVRAPAEETAARDTYTAHYGVRGASYLLAAVTILALGAFLALVPWLSPRRMFLWLILLPVLGLAAALRQFSLRSTPGAARRVFVATAVSVLCTQALFLLAVQP